MADSIREIERTLKNYPLWKRELQGCMERLANPDDEISAKISNYSGTPRGGESDYSPVERAAEKREKLQSRLQERAQELRYLIIEVDISMEFLEGRTDAYMPMQAIQLRYLKEMDEQAIAKKFGVKPGKVTGWIKDGLKILQLYSCIRDNV